MYRPYVQRAAKQALLPKQLQLAGLGWPAGCHFLVSETTQVPIPEVLGFLRSQYLSRSLIGLKRSPRSLEAGTYDLKDFYGFLDAHRLKALEVGLNEIENYLNSMHLHDSPVTDRPFAIATIKRRASTVCAFYRWANENGLTKQKIEMHALTALKRDEIRYLTLDDRLQQPKGQRRDKKVKFIPNEKLRRILSASGPLRVDPENRDEPPSGRTRLMFECALQAGLRRFEISRLEVDSVLKGARIATGRNLTDKCPVELFRKGGKYRTVMMPVWLIKNLRHYIQSERHEAIQARVRLNQEFADHGLVFVKAIGSGSKTGDALSQRYLSGPMRQIQHVLGIREGQSSRCIYGVHALRHTYALMEYFARKSDGDSEPWLYVQAQLGHNKLSTTTDIYLALAAEYEYEFGEILKEGFQQAKVYG